MIGGWAWSATTNTVEVLAARDTIHRGEVIDAEDLLRVRMSGDTALRTVSSSAYDDVVGQRAALDVAAGGLLTAESTTEEALPPAGRSVVGISLAPAQVPALPLYGGDSVRVIATPADGDVLTSVTQFTIAEVVDTRLDEATGNTIINVLVPYAEAATLAARAATGNVAVVLDAGAE